MQIVSSCLCCAEQLNPHLAADIWNKIEKLVTEACARSHAFKMKSVRLGYTQVLDERLESENSMKEAEISYQISECLNRIWAIQQWWASVSIGVLIMAQLAMWRLNLFFILISLGLYTSYTLYILQMLRGNLHTVNALADDLEALVKIGVVNSNNASEMISVMDSNPFLFYLTFGGTYLSICSYLIYNYRKARSDRPL